MRHRECAAFVLACVLSVLQGGCCALCNSNGDDDPTEEPKNTATAQCGSLQNFRSDLGLLNDPDAEIGTVFLAHSENKKAVPIYQKTPEEEFVEEPGERNTNLKTKFGREFKVSGSFQSDVKAEEIKAELKTKLEKQAELNVEKMGRTDLVDPTGYLNQEEIRKKAVRELEHNPEATLFVVYSTTEADSLELTAGNNAESSVSVNVGSTDVNVEVTFKCEELFEKTDGPAFFKAWAYKLAETSDSERRFVTDASPSVKISEVSFEQLVQ